MAVLAFGSILKRGIMGSYSQVSCKYLPLYVADFSSAITAAAIRTFSPQRFRAVSKFTAALKRQYGE